MLNARLHKLEEAASDHPEANLAMKWIGEVYVIDARAGNDLAKLAELRRTESAEVIARMKAWLWNQATLKTLSIAKAAAYAIANWDRLTRFIGDARVPLDNTATEQGIRGPAVGRRDWVVLRVGRPRDRLREPLLVDRVLSAARPRPGDLPSRSHPRPSVLGAR